MQPSSPKRFAECPRCHSPAVHVPWRPQAAAWRRKVGLWLALLWLTSVLWLIVGLVQGGFLWLGALAVYTVITVVVAVLLYRNVRGYRCGSCGLRWSI